VNICFDTSAINALCDDPDSDKLLAKIRASHKVLLTSLSIVEVVANSDEERCHSLLRCMKSLSDGTLPLAMPNKLVRRAARAFVKGKRALTVTITREEAPTWWFVNDASLAGQNEQAEAFQWMRALEDPFLQSHRDARAALQKVLTQSAQSWPRSASELIRHFRKSDHLYSLVKDLFRRETGEFLSRDAMWRLFQLAPQWPLYLAGWAHEMFARVFQTSHYGPKGKPGTLDLWCAVYLPLCDALVTNDKGQYRALRLLNVLSRRVGDRPMPKTRVLKYAAFRRTLM
jgi:hypothetical protein